jgi:antitoxin HicB
MLRYPVKLVPDDNGTMRVEARDLPEVNTFGDDEADALHHAVDAIATALQGRISNRQKLPDPSGAKRGERLVTLPAIVAAKLALYRTMMETNTRKADLARKLKVHPPQIDRLLDLDHDSRLDQLEKAARAMGHEMHIELKPAA